jgi:hypothetical protein
LLQARPHIGSRTSGCPPATPRHRRNAHAARGVAPSRPVCRAMRGTSATTVAFIVRDHAAHCESWATEGADALTVPPSTPVSGHDHPETPGGSRLPSPVVWGHRRAAECPAAAFFSRREHKTGESTSGTTSVYKPHGEPTMGDVCTPRASATPPQLTSAPCAAPSPSVGRTGTDDTAWGNPASRAAARCGAMIPPDGSACAACVTRCVAGDPPPTRRRPPRGGQ